MVESLLHGYGIHRRVIACTFPTKSGRIFTNAEDPHEHRMVITVAIRCEHAAGFYEDYVNLSCVLATN